MSPSNEESGSRYHEESVAISLRRIADALDKLTAVNDEGYMELELMICRAIKGAR